MEVGPVDGDGFPGAVVRAVADTGASAVLPASDAALLALGAPGDDLVDKTRLLDAARSVGIGTPETQVFSSAEDLIAAAETVRFPAVLKLPISRVPARRVAGPEDLRRAALGRGPFLLQPFIDEPVWAVGGVVWKGRMVAAVHQRYLRTWPLDCGTASAAITVEPDRGNEERLLALLDSYDGIFQAQFAGEALLDLNPRVYGSLPLAVAAGANLPSILCDLLRGREPSEVRARPGVAYRWLEGDVRAVSGLVRTRRMTPATALRALTPRRGSAHSVVALRDPVPFFSRLRYAARGRR